MSILETIRQKKLAEVLERKKLYPIKQLERSIYFDTECISLKRYLTRADQMGIIAEFKRKSPSRGIINIDADVEETTRRYIQAGASALSILTDETFFGAKKDDLLLARKLNHCPILRKDFIIDQYQILESKAMGADVILLIAKMLPPGLIKEFTDLAHQLGMEVLLEMHTESEIIENRETTADLAGINNRNLNDFAVDIENSIRLAAMLPETMVKVSESGIESPQVIKRLRDNGFSGFLIGEYFMKEDNPSAKCAELIRQLKL